MKCWIVIGLISLACAALVLVVGFNLFKLDALTEPGHLETILATRAKHAIVRRSSRGALPPAPTNLQASIEEGDKLFGTECSECHGNTGRNPTDAGKWMYPRAADLASPEVQKYSDRELFWIVKNGIRLSGMPAFGRVESDAHIWNLVHFTRTLQAEANPKGEDAP